MAETVTVTTREVELLKGWVAGQKATMPADVQRVMERVLRIMAVLETLFGRHKNLLKSFHETMGITPKSERGAALSNQ